MSASEILTLMKVAMFLHITLVPWNIWLRDRPWSG